MFFHEKKKYKDLDFFIKLTYRFGAIPIKTLFLEAFRMVITFIGEKHKRYFI